MRLYWSSSAIVLNAVHSAKAEQMNYITTKKGTGFIDGRTDKENIMEGTVTLPIDEFLKLIKAEEAAHLDGKIMMIYKDDWRRRHIKIDSQSLVIGSIRKEFEKKANFDSIDLVSYLNLNLIEVKNKDVKNHVKDTIEGYKKTYANKWGEPWNYSGQSILGFED